METKQFHKTYIRIECLRGWPQAAVPWNTQLGKDGMLPWTECFRGITSEGIHAYRVDCGVKL